MLSSILDVAVETNPEKDVEKAPKLVVVTTLHPANRRGRREIKKRIRRDYHRNDRVVTA